MTAAQEQLTLSSRAMVTIDFRIDLMWSDGEIARHILLHLLSCVGDIPKLIEMARRP